MQVTLPTSWFCNTIFVLQINTFLKHEYKSKKGNSYALSDWMCLCAPKGLWNWMFIKYLMTCLNYVHILINVKIKVSCFWYLSATEKKMMLLI